MRSSVCSARTMLVRRIGESGCGYWPTPNSHEECAERYTVNTSFRHHQEGRQVHLSQVARDPRMWPTPQRFDASWGNGGENANVPPNQVSLFGAVGGALNPPWVEWLMGWPVGWTDCEPSAMDKYPHNSLWLGSY